MTIFCFAKTTSFQNKLEQKSLAVSICQRFLLSNQLGKNKFENIFYVAGKGESQAKKVTPQMTQIRSCYEVDLLNYLTYTLWEIIYI